MPSYYWIKQRFTGANSEFSIMSNTSDVNGTRFTTPDGCHDTAKEAWDIFIDQQKYKVIKLQQELARAKSEWSSCKRACEADQARQESRTAEGNRIEIRDTDIVLTLSEASIARLKELIGDG